MSKDLRHYLNIVQEAAATPSLLSKTFFHGCPKEVLALQIMENGIQPPSIEVVAGKYGAKRGKMTPVGGRVYLAQDLSYAIIYAIGGNMAGHEIWPEKLEKDGRFGYLFVVPGSELSDVQPDEDSVGEFLSKHSEQKWDQSTKPWRNLGYHFKSDGIEDLAKKQVYDFISQNMTDSQRLKAMSGLLADQAAGGKRVLKKMPDWMKLKLIEWGAHIANSGPVVPSEVWRIDKTRTKDLKRDGSNFFEIAERVR